MPKPPTWLYQQNGRYFAQVAGGLEDEGIAEVKALGGRHVEKAYRGLYFNATPADLYGINYMSRLVTRVLAPLTAFTCHNTKYLYRKAKEIPWGSFLKPGQTFAVAGTVSNSKIRHSKYAALCVKDALVDQFRENTGTRPSVDRHNPDLWINIHIENNHATLAVDTSGGSLHRRGYRRESVAAPMQETVAAAVVRWSGWDGEVPLLDPMCGSGTLLAEAIMSYRRLPPAFLREHFGFMQLPDFDAGVWDRVKSRFDQQVRPLPAGLVTGSDRSSDAVEAARQNLSSLTADETFELIRRDFRAIEAWEQGVMLCNPPYGLRLQPGEDLGPFYKAFGDFLKQKCTGTVAYIYFGNRIWIKRIGLRSSWKRPLANGPLDGRVVKYEMY